MGTLKTLLQLAAGEIGYSSANPYIGYNPGNLAFNKYCIWYYGWNNQVDFCGIFIAWCAAQAGVSSQIIPQQNINAAYVPTVLQWFKDKQLFQTRNSYSTPKAGDIIFFDWDGNNVPNHIGIVEAVEGSNVITLEGNTSKSGESGNGGGVWRKSRSKTASYILGYGLPEYNSEEENENMTIRQITIKHKELGDVKVDAVNVNDQNYVLLRDMEKLAPILVDWDGSNPTVQSNFKK